MIRLLPIVLAPALYILLFSQLHTANLMSSIGLSMFAVRQFDAGDVAVGFLGSVMLLAYGSLAWFGGLLADRYPKRALIPFGLGLLAVVFWATPFASKFVHLIILAGLTSIMFTAIMPAHFGLIGETVHPQKVSRYLSFNALMLVLFGTAGAFVVGRLFESGGPRLVFHISGSIAALITLFVLICAPRNENAGPEISEEPTPSPDVTFRPHPDAGAFFKAGLALNFLGFFVGIMHQHFLVRLATVPSLAMTLTEQSNIQAVRMLCAGLGYVVGVIWTGWHWKQSPFWAAAALMLAVTGIAGFAPNPLVLGLAIGMGGFGSAVCNQMSLYYAIGGGAVSGGKGAGLHETALALGGALGPLTGGAFAMFAGTPRAALFAPLLPIAGCVLIWVVLLPQSGKPAPR